MFSSKTVTAYAVATAMSTIGGNAAATPLYRLYQDAFGFSAGLTTIIFAAYVASLLVALLVVGRLSDFIGRKPMILVALLINLVALALFFFAGSTWELIAARMVQGLAVGCATTTLGAVILDTDKAHAPMLNGIINFAGLAVGALLAGTLASFAPFPTHLVFVVLACLSIIEIGLLMLVPETAEKKPWARGVLRPHVELPAQVVAAFLRITPVNIAAWSLGGFYLSLMPSLVVQVTGVKVPLLGASVVATLMVAGSAALVAVQNIEARKVLLGGSITLVAGVFITLAGLYWSNVTLMFIGSAIAGGGFGATFSGIIRSILPLAASTERAGLLSTFYVESYLAFAVPAVIAGFVSPVLGFVATVYWYAALVIVLTLVSFVISLRAKEPTAS